VQLTKGSVTQCYSNTSENNGNRGIDRQSGDIFTKNQPHTVLELYIWCGFFMIFQCSVQNCWLAGKIFFLRTFLPGISESWLPSPRILGDVMRDEPQLYLQAYGDGPQLYLPSTGMWGGMDLSCTYLTCLRECGVDGPQLCLPTWPMGTWGGWTPVMPTYMTYGDVRGMDPSHAYLHDLWHVWGCGEEWTPVMPTYMEKCKNADGQRTRWRCNTHLLRLSPKNSPAHKTCK
jgi:hypothetical protein